MSARTNEIRRIAEAAAGILQGQGGRVAAAATGLVDTAMLLAGEVDALERRLSKLEPLEHRLSKLERAAATMPPAAPKEPKTKKKGGE